MSDFKIYREENITDALEDSCARCGSTAFRQGSNGGSIICAQCGREWEGQQRQVDPLPTRCDLCKHVHGRDPLGHGLCGAVFGPPDDRQLCDCGDDDRPFEAPHHGRP